MALLDRLLRQQSKHWTEADYEETPIACPDCEKPFGHLGLLESFDLTRKEFLDAVRVQASAVREHPSHPRITCPHCGCAHDVNYLGVWMFLLLCMWEVLLEKKVIAVDGGFAAFVRHEEKVTRKAKNR
jgi:hypothetical protein